MYSAFRIPVNIKAYVDSVLKAFIAVSLIVRKKYISLPFVSLLVQFLSDRIIRSLQTHRRLEAVSIRRPLSLLELPATAQRLGCVDISDRIIALAYQPQSDRIEVITVVT
jgi:hypothetical protein